MKSIILTASFFLFAAPLGAQEFYKWKDANGRWRFSDTRPPGDSEKVSFKESPLQFPVKELPCAAFEPGDSRAALGYDLGTHSPVRVEDVHLRRLDGQGGTGHFSWKLVLQNGSDREVVARPVLSLMDCGESVVAEEKIAGRTLAPFEVVTLSGTRVIHGPQANKVARFRVQVGTR